jgi:hypothetical protein
MSLTMMVALVFGILLCSGISTAQTAPSPAPPTMGRGLLSTAAPTLLLPSPPDRHRINVLRQHSREACSGESG